jgi:hypothetical protein
MSRQQQSQVLATGTADNATDQANAQQAVTAENADIGNYDQQLSKYAANNPYTEGGEFQTEQNKTLAANADVGSKAITNQVETQAQRTGQNAGAAVATAEEAARANERDLAAGEGSAETTRIGNDANYNAGVLQATATPITAEQGVYGTSVGAADSVLGTEAGVSATPGFWDNLGDSFAQGLGKAAGTQAG